MLDLIGLSADARILAFIGVLLTFVLTLALLKVLGGKLPLDAGRAYAHDGTLSVGKPRGAGLVFILAFVAMAAVFLPFSLERLINLALVTAAMLTGFMDDRSGKPWGELKKGILDLILSLAVALTFLAFNTTTITLPLTGASFTLPPVLFAVLATLLVWTSINVTNCADGVDGLSGSLSIITLLSVYLLGTFKAIDAADNQLILFLIFAVLAYLWYNATPSLMIMGDAGSRALGLFISVAILKTGSPLLYIPLALVLILDGGLGLVKVTIIRICKVNIMKQIRTPLHDHVRKNLGWSNTHTVFRFAIVQAVIAFLVLWFLQTT